jgi:hypothetical protein
MDIGGVLAIRSDISFDVEADYLAWLSREHTHERLGIDGFLSARIFRCCRSDVRRYLIVYGLESPVVLDSPAYLERLNAPTPWSARMMPQMQSFVRSGGAVIASAGAGSGTAMLPLMIDGGAVDTAKAVVSELERLPDIIAIRLMQADAKRTAAPTLERGLRGGDGMFDGLLLIESLSIDGLLAAISASRLRTLIDEAKPDEATYLEVFHLSRL